MIRARFLLLPVLCAFVSGCSRADFDTKKVETFQSDCQRQVVDLSRKLGEPTDLVANLFKAYALGVSDPEIMRRFDPSRPPDVAGSWIITAKNGLDPCSALVKKRDAFTGISVWTAFDAGLSQWMAAMEAERHAVRSMRDRIKDTIAGKLRVSGKVADLIGRFAPRGIAFVPVQKNGRMVPSVTIRAVNVLDIPIDGFYWSIDLRRPDGSVLATGRLSFRPPVPLGPGVEADYRVFLNQVKGFQDPKLGNIRSEVKVKVKTEDVIAGGERLLKDSIVDREDKPRVDALGVMLGRIADIEDFVQRVRVRAEAVR
ncbi:MAG: hypothetical protein EPN75_08700 [Beijerinckiaceae bacterium]|nr:MAG: hypothetical protein EPN75_08700 [Beijerinckiaceae bacterium]